MSLLTVKNCGIHFGGLQALGKLSFSLAAGELLGIIGPNGAGKTTFFNLLTGVYAPSTGEIFFDGKSLNGLKPYQVNHLGIARTFQNIRLFADLTVLDNVRIAFYQHIHYSLLDVVLQRKKYRQEEEKIIAEARTLLKEFSLDASENDLAKNLSYGDQRRLEMVRALATRPKLLLLDEPAAGMNSTEKHALMQLISHLHQKLKLSILLIEHDMKVVMGLCPRLIVLDHGIPLAEGSPEQIKNNPEVIKAYLGEARVRHHAKD